MAKKAGKSATKASKKSSSKTSAAKPKKNYSTVGIIRSLNLTNSTFTLEPIIKYRFEVKDDDENSWKTMFKEENADKNIEPSNLKLIPQDATFKFEKGLKSAMVVLKQAKSKIKVVVDEAQLKKILSKSSANQTNVVTIEVL